MRRNPIEEGVATGLRQFLMYLRAKGIVFHMAEAELIADEFREFFLIPCPMEVLHSSQLLNDLDYEEVFLKKGLQRDQHIRGNWLVYNRVMRIFIDAEPPASRQIKSLLHEVIEPLFKLSYLVWPYSMTKTQSEQEAWARRFAAMVKIPASDFPANALECGLDLGVLKEKYSDTLACCARQIRDLLMQRRLFFYARFELIGNALRHCPRLVPFLQESNGLCVCIHDAARSMQKQRPAGAMPDFNLPSYVQYKFIHPAFREYIADRRAILVDNVPGGSGWNEYRPDLLGENDLSVLLRPYGFKRRAFYMLAVHPSDLMLLRPQTDRLMLKRLGSLDWLFSFQTDKYKAGPTEDVQLTLVDDRDDGDLYDLEAVPMRWPGVMPYNEHRYDSIGQGSLFRPSDLRAYRTSVASDFPKTN